jgi:dihydroorotate dehydrogenase (NAD+) catalytic subunit
MVEETVALKSNQQIGTNIWLMEFRSTLLASHAKPGQFLMVHLGERTKDPLLRRPFSIHGIQDGDKVMILYNVVGARAIQVGTANFVNPKTAIEIVHGLTDFCSREKVSNINQIIGGLKTM